MHRINLKILPVVLIILLQIFNMGNKPYEDINLSKLDPRFRSLVAGGSDQNLIQLAQSRFLNVYTDENDKIRFGVIIKTSDAGEIRAAGVHVNTELNEFVTANVTLEQMKILTRISGVEHIDAPVISYPTMNASIPISGAALVHNGFINDTEYQGDGAIVLIYDTGIDIHHLDFRNPADTTQSRILAIWDQIGSGGNPPNGFDYGVEYTQTDINDEIDGSPTGFVQQKDIDGHGTHVAGSAAGNGSAFTGVAPQADIIVVKGGDGSFFSSQVMDGLTYAEAKAAQFGKPIVVNLSLGGQWGPHDGSTAYEQAMDAFNSKSGQVVVAAAGNDGGDLIHLAGSASSGGSATININVPDGYTPEDGPNNDVIHVNLWYSENVTVTAKIISPNNIVYERGNDQEGSPSNKNDGLIYLNNEDYGNLHLIELQISDETADKTPAPGIWTLELYNASGDLNFDTWLNRFTLGDDRARLENADNQKSVGIPATSIKVLTVGAYVTKKTWNDIDGFIRWYSVTLGAIAPFSSLGPTRDGRLKPDIAAPGMAIGAALSRDAEAPEGTAIPTGEHLILQGTSMACPHVAGTAALLLANNPALHADEIRTILKNTATKDNRTEFPQPTPNQTWGAGKLSILNAVLKQVYGDSAATHTHLHYDKDEGAGALYTFTGTQEMSVRFSAPHAGQVTSAHLQVIYAPNQEPIIDGTGNLLVSVHEDATGFPGTQIGNTVSYPIQDLTPGISNYINMLDAQASVTANQNYHVVIKLANSSDAIKISFDDGSLFRSKNPSTIKPSAGSNWMMFSDAFSGTPYNLRLHSEITLIEQANAIAAERNSIVHSFALEQNFPNPFNPSTRVRYSLAQRGQVDLVIFDILGRKVATLVSEVKSPGQYEVEWNSTASGGYQVPSGVYFYRIKTSEGVLTRKMLMVK